jgi:phosphatidylglycerol:prolipoprotein diacylglycerol transferase
MYPILTQLGLFRLRSYDAFVALGGCLAFIFLKSREKEIGFREEADFWVLVSTIIGSGFIGARLFYMLLNMPSGWEGFWRDLLSINNNFTVFGFIAGVSIGAISYSRIHEMQATRLLDYVYLSVAIWQVFGRFGCFMNGCCFGRPVQGDVPWAVTFSDPHSAIPTELLGVRLHAAQLYEAGAVAVLAAILWFVLREIERGRVGRGLVCVGYLAGYGAIRFVNEWFRADTRFVLGTAVTVGQAFSLSLMLSAVALLLVVRSDSRRLGSKLAA